ncbi:ArsC/Spx/MgsR family protein [Anaerotignum neopropionicum]
MNSADVKYFERHMVEENPSSWELEFWWEMSDLPLKNFFNTSGVLYKQLGLKDKLPQMTAEEQLQLLGTNGLLVKRPLLVGEDFVLVGFREEEWQNKLLR